MLGSMLGLPQGRKIADIETLIVILWFSILMCVFLSDTLSDVIETGTLLLVSIGLGALLWKSIARERRQKEKLAELSALKTEFLSFATHELRNPLAAIGGYAEMLLLGGAGRLSPEQKGIIENMSEAAENLARIAEDFLDSAKIEQGGFSYDMAECDLAHLARDCVREMRIEASGKGVNLSFGCDDRARYLIFGDRQKLRHAFGNAIGNAVKYTREGSVSVRLFKNERGSVLEVSDTGIGIGSEDMPAVFEKFARGAHGRTVGPGSGIGLYLAKEIVNAHGGAIRIESEGLGKGSQAYIELPGFGPDIPRMSSSAPA